MIEGHADANAEGSRPLSGGKILFRLTYYENIGGNNDIEYYIN